MTAGSRVVLAHRRAPSILAMVALVAALFGAPAHVRADTATSVVLTSKPNPALPSVPITFTATVSPVPSGGSVTLYRDQYAPTPLTIETVPVNTADGTAVFTPYVAGRWMPDTYYAVYDGVPGAFTGNTSARYTHITSFLPLAGTLHTDDPLYVNTDLHYQVALSPAPGAGSVQVWGSFNRDSQLPYLSVPIDPTTGIGNFVIRYDHAVSDTLTLYWDGADYTNDYGYTGVFPATIAWQYVTTVTASFDSEPGFPGPATVTATVTPTPPGGTVKVFSGQFEIGESAVDASTGVATIPVTGLTAGTHDYGVTFFGVGTYSPSSTVVTHTLLPAPTVDLSVPGAVTIGLDSSATFTAHVDISAPSGTVTFYRGDLVQATRSVGVGNIATYTAPVTAFPPGSYQVTAHFNGNTDYAPSASAPQPFTVFPDTVVRATSLAVSPSAFYPVVDSYLDTAKFSGTLQETASVSMGVYSASNVLVRSFALTPRSGAFSVLWNGRNTAGAMVAAGQYHVVFRLTDTRGNHLTVTRYVTVSLKKLYYSHVTYARLATTYNAIGHAGIGKVLVYSDGSVALVGGTGVGPSYEGWAATAYQFTLPSATTYSMTFSGYFTDAHDFLEVGTWNFSRCAYSTSTTWPITCFDGWKTNIGTGVWASTTLASTNRYGRIVRGAVESYHGTGRLYKVQLSVTYGILK